MASDIDKAVADLRAECEALREENGQLEALRDEEHERANKAESDAAGVRSESAELRQERDEHAEKAMRFAQLLANEAIARAEAAEAEVARLRKRVHDTLVGAEAGIRAAMHVNYGGYDAHEESECARAFREGVFETVDAVRRALAGEKGGE